MNHTNKKIALLVWFITFSLISNAQNFEWLKTYGEKKSDFVLDISTESDGGLAFISHHDVQVSKSDTFHFDTVSVIRPKGTLTNFLIKQDSNGKVKMIRKTGYLQYDANMCKDKAGNYYLTGLVQDSVMVDSQKFFKSNGTMIFLKYDKNFKLIWATQTGFKSTTSFSLTFSEGHIYFTAVTVDTSKVGTTTYISQTQDYIFGEINKTNGSVIWSKRLITGSTRFRITSLVSLKGNLYVAGDFDITSTSAPTSVIINKDTLWGPGGFVLQTDTLGNYKRSFNFHNKKNLRVNCISTDGEFLYIGGNFADTLSWGKEKILPSFVISGSQGDNEHFAASLTADLQPRWFYHPKIVIKGGNNSVLSVTTGQGYIYFGCIMAARSVVINGDTLETAANADVLLFKMDFLGNILWATIGGSTNKDWIVLRTLDVAGKSVFAAGYFYGTIQLGGFKDTTRGYDGDCWIAKISDYSITRGKVKSGPYCAGDSILIPYTKFGDFDTSNTFIAQLSDEEGNFESGYRELGRLKSNKDGTIIGKLPLFNVSSSLNYRIRILSTKPAVQSYYRRDSLRLLIYSRDKADPGKPETICKGDTIKLNTFGGTKWNWSPKYRMDDSALREPRVWPQLTTTYKIIIGDSSGCGQPDTAYKLIIVRPALKSVLAFTDTSLCVNNPIKVPVQFKGGDSTSYQWQWYFVSSPKSWFAMGNGLFKQNDTLNYTPADPEEKLVLVLSDGCTFKKDTSFLSIHLRTSVNLKNRIRDTFVCNGNKLNFKAKAFGGNTKFYQWQWKDITNNTILSKTDSLSLTAKKTTKIELTVNDGCVALGDTQQFTVFVNPPLKASILTDKGNLNDTSICHNQSFKLFSSGKGGTGTGYTFKWYLDKTLVSTSDTFQLNTNVLNLNTYILHLVLKDNCTKDADSVTKTISVIESPKADFSVGNACNLNPIQFTFTGTKPPSPITTTFLWDFNGETTSTIANPLQQLKNTGNKAIQLKVTASNGCIDIITKNINIKPQAKANFDVEDVCEDSQAVFINKTTVTSGKPTYRWYFGDGKTSSEDTPSHTFNIAGVTQTFNVKLAADIPAGCSDSVTKAVTINANPKQGFSYTISGQTVNFTAIETIANTYQWTFGDGGTASTNNRQKSYTYSKFPSGKYTACLRVINLAGCISDSCMEILITGGVQNLNRNLGIQIYPNPNTGNFNIEIIESKGKSYLEIYNQVGQTLYIKELVQSLNTLDLKLANGMYLIRVTNGENVYNSRIIISH